jgi:hypothetical protein
MYANTAESDMATVPVSIHGKSCDGVTLPASPDKISVKPVCDDATRPRIIFPRRKGGDTRHHTRPVRVTRQMLQALFHLPLPSACKHLGLCATTFKKACRREGIMQWPYKRGCCSVDTYVCEPSKANSSSSDDNISAPESPYNTDCESQVTASPKAISDTPFSPCKSPISAVCVEVFSGEDLFLPELSYLQSEEDSRRIGIPYEDVAPLSLDLLSWSEPEA